MPKPELVAGVGRRLTLVEWQQAIDGQMFLVPLVLAVSRAGEAPGTQRATLGGEPVSFGFAEVDVPAAEAAKGWRFAFATPASGDLKSCAAGAMALLAYAEATGGGLGCGAAASSFRDLKQQLDAMLATAFSKVSEYNARYRADGRTESGGMAIGVTRAQ